MGISVHGHFRIVTENSVFAMPEVLHYLLRHPSDCFLMLGAHSFCLDWTANWVRI